MKQHVHSRSTRTLYYLLLEPALLVFTACTGNTGTIGESSNSGLTCTPYTDEEFCASLNKNCDEVMNLDNCGQTRTSVNCGSCFLPQTCGGGGTPNVCGCTPETNTEFCARLGTTCGLSTGMDNCGLARTVTDCGPCSSDQWCTTEQSCATCNTPEHCGPTCQSCSTQGNNKDCINSTCGCDGPEDCSQTDTCLGGTCTGCSPDCADKCEGASDGCGGTCNGPCPSGQWCREQVCTTCTIPTHCGTSCTDCTTQSNNNDCIGGLCGCNGPEDCSSTDTCVGETCIGCAPNCVGKCGGVSDGCGGTCSATCPSLCPDGTCNGTEDCLSCEADCGICAATYYVNATGGSDTSNGTTEALAWRTLAKVNNTTFSPGDRILLKRGETWTGTLEPHSSGSAGRYITFGAYGSGNRPIVDGTTSSTSLALWNGTYHHLRFQNIDFNGSNYINYGAVSAQSHDLYFYDCIFRNGKNGGFLAWSESGAEIYNIVVDSCTAYNNTKSGIMISSATGAEGPHDCVVDNCIAYNNGTNQWADHGIYIRYGGIVRNSTSFNNPVGAGIKVNSEGIHSPYTPVVYNNVCYGNFIGLYAVNTGAIYYNNLVYDNQYNVNFDSDSHDMIFVFNTIINSGSGGYAFRIEANMANTVIKNNLIIQDRSVSPFYVYNGLSLSTLDYLAANNSIDYNVFYTDGNITTKVFKDADGSYGWTEWIGLQGSPDSHSTFLGAPPDVVLPYTDMHPTLGGNLKGAGMKITGYSLDKDGVVRADPPTPGCYE